MAWGIEWSRDRWLRDPKSQKRIRAHYGAAVGQDRLTESSASLDDVRGKSRLCLGLTDAKRYKVPYFGRGDVKSASARWKVVSRNRKYILLVIGRWTRGQSCIAIWGLIVRKLPNQSTWIFRTTLGPRKSITVRSTMTLSQNPRWRTAADTIDVMLAYRPIGAYLLVGEWLTGKQYLWDRVTCDQFDFFYYFSYFLLIQATCSVGTPFLSIFSSFLAYSVKDVCRPILIGRYDIGTMLPRAIPTFPTSVTNVSYVLLLACVLGRPMTLRRPMFYRGILSKIPR